MAVSEPGSFFDTFGTMMIISSEMSATKRVGRCTPPKWLMYTPHLPMKSPGIFSVMVRPKKSGICVEKIVRAMPAVKPTTIG